MATTLGSTPGTTPGTTEPNDHAKDIDPHDEEMVAYWSDPTKRTRNAIFAVNVDMRRNYAALKAELINHLTPVIVVQNDSQGGLYTLVHNGEREAVHPVSELFELAKSIAHVPLGTFAILAPYLKGPDANGWSRPLKHWAHTLRTAHAELAGADLPPALLASSTRILDGALGFIGGALERGSFSIEEFTDFTGDVYESIRTNMYFAAKAQIAGVESIMRRWRQKVGEEQWKGLYVVVLSIWTTSVLNQNSIIIKQFLDPATADSHLIDLPTGETPADPVFTALDNLARIVQDNVAAELVFPVDQVIADALKGKQDLLSEEIQTQLACPFQSKRAARDAAQGAAATEDDRPQAA
ncbi:hypothetical protein CFP65_1268 [Kitasatospora sp. MMS16-BH015]|uniref:hypothetical protein n=1 Tax=Kitasatospora sp. MMS16-BH015 TaxID=2018025 RepID=UPI000CA38E96|nr:hypothetical protein [Kitasatospora sp. MMS16-BH015]AUG76169.1 hypothetical protein CFP65_1268 [Kitasatospora sp. MMS16-BH015]